MEKKRCSAAAGNLIKSIVFIYFWPSTNHTAEYIDHILIGKISKISV